MGTQIKSAVSFVNVAPGAIATLAHGLVGPDGRALLPDIVILDAAGFAVTAVGDISISVRNDGPDPANLNVLLEAWHTIERAFGDAADLNLPVKPFIVTPSGSGGGNPIVVQDEGAVVGVRGTLNFIGAGVTAVDDPGNNRIDVTIPGGGGGEPAILGFGNGNIGAAADTRHLDPWFGGRNEVADTGLLEMPAPRAGTVQSLFVRHNAPVGNGNNVVYTLLVNGVATGVTVTLASNAAQASDLANSIAVAQGDRLALRASKAAAIGNANLEVVATMELV